MLQINNYQMDKLSIVPQEIFLKKMAKHLDDISRTIYPEQKFDFSSIDALNRLRGELQYLMEHAFSDEMSLASAIEFFELYDIAQANPETRQVIEQGKLTVSQKLDKLWLICEKSISK